MKNPRPRTVVLLVSAFYLFGGGTSAGFAAEAPKVRKVAATNDLAGRPIVVEAEGWKPSYMVRTNAQGKLVVVYEGDTMDDARPRMPVIEIDENGATAKNARHTVVFKANLNQDGAVSVRTDDGKRLQGRPVALSISDGNGNRIWLGEAQDCEGEIIGEEATQVLYPDAFSGIRADVLFTYDLNRFEQDIILREHPVLPPEMDEATARLEVWSAFENPPEPRKIRKKVILREADPVRGKPEISADDEVLDFGAMRMAQGSAFAIDGVKRAEPGSRTPVIKLWLREKQQNLLLESADYIALKPELEKLAPFQANLGAVTSTTNLAFVTERAGSASRKGDSQRASLFKDGRKKSRLMALGPQLGVVIDYTLVYTSLLNIDFGDGHTGSAAVARTGSENDLWNSLYTPWNTYGSLSPLVWSDGTSVGPTSEVVLENAPGHWGNSTANGMMNDYVYPHNGGNITVTLKNIPPGRYNIFIYGAWGHVGGVNGNYTLSVGGTDYGNRQTVLGQNWAALNWTENEHFVCYPNVQVTGGQQIRVEAMPGADVAVINGIQMFLVGNPPSISPIADQVTTVGVPVGPLSFTVSDPETQSPFDLTVIAHSGNLAVIPDQNIELTCCTTRTIRLTPAAAQTGSSLITHGVWDPDGNYTSRTFNVTVNSGSGGGGGELVTNVDPGGSQRNNWSYWLGFRFTVGSSPMVVNELGRWVLSGNSQNHAMKIFNADGSVVPNSEVTVTTAGKPSAAFTYASLAAPVTLQAGATYFVMSHEPEGGDFWRNDLLTPITLNGAAHTPISAWSEAAYPGNIYLNEPNLSYVPVNLRFGGGAGGNTAPTISSIADVTVNQNASTGPIGFTVGDVETPAANLNVSATSGNLSLVPGANIVFGGSGANRTVTINPAANLSGSASINVIVTDGGGLVATRTFTVNVRLWISSISPLFNADHSTATLTAASQAGATVRYTIDGTDPTEVSGTNSPVIGSPATVVKARAYQSGFAPSPVLTFPGLEIAAPVTFSPNSHSPIEYGNGPLAVQMNAESGATVIYQAGGAGSWNSAANGSSPSIDGIDAGNGTIQAYAYTLMKFRSATTTSGEYSFRLPQPANTIAYNAGTATLTFNTLPSALIDLFFNGSASVSETLAANGSGLATRSFNAATAVKARARKTGYIDSGMTTAHVNKLPIPRMATAAGVASQNIFADNPIDVWLVPNFGFENVYGEKRTASDWGGPLIWSSDSPNVNFPGALFSTVGGNLEFSNNALPVSYGRSYTASVWLKGITDGGSYYGFINYDAAATDFICAEDINENGYGITYLTQPLANGATTAYLANEQIFSPISPEYYFNFFVPLGNFSRTAPIQKVNQPNPARDILQFIDPWSAPWPYVTSVSAGNKSITLSSAYTGATLPAGTPIARRGAGGWYQYLEYHLVPSAWTFYQRSWNYLRPGTEQIRLMFLLAYGGTSTGMSGYEFWEGTAAQKPKLYYTINGGSELQADGPLKLSFDPAGGPVTISLRQKGANYFDSDVLIRTIIFKVASPQITSRIEGNNVILTATTTTVGDAIFYTIDGSEPTVASNPYTDASEITVPATTTTKWKAFKSIYTASDTVTKWGVPTFNPPGGAYGSGQSVTITAAAGAQLKVFQPNPNILNPSLWSSGVVGSYPSFNYNGGATENQILVRKTPYGTMENVWVAFNQDAASDPDGGWHGSDFAVDKTKTYRYSVWIRKSDTTPASSSGYTYLGCRANQVSTLTGTSTDLADGNPYFWLGVLPLNEWYLLVGYIHPAGHLGTTHFGRAYNAKGEVVSNSTDFRSLSTTTVGSLRTYLYYCTELGIEQEFWNPRVEVINSVNDPIDVLFVAPESSPKTITLNGNVGNDLVALSWGSGISSQSPAIMRTYSFKVAVPTISVAAAGADQVTLTVTTSTGQAEIRYTVNGSEPVATSTLYTGPITQPAASHVRFKAFKTNFQESDVSAYQGGQSGASTPSGLYGTVGLQVFTPLN